MILSCIRRIYDKLGYYVGINLIGNVLRGSKIKRVTELGLNDVSTYGLLKDRPRSEIHAMIDHLEGEEYLETEPEHQTLRLTPKAAQVLYQGAKVQMKVEVQEQEASLSAPAGDEADLFDALKMLRQELAKEAGIPAYVVFSNATLTDMARKKPKTMSEFRKISGVGELKAAWYGKTFLERIQRFEMEKE